MLLPTTDDTCVVHERVGWPSTSTVQQPHCPTPQPNFVPVSPRSPRNANWSVALPSAGTLTSRPLTRKGTVAMRPLPEYGCGSAGQHVQEMALKSREPL